MVVLASILLVLAAALPIAQVAAHPGHDATIEMKQRAEYVATLKNVGLAHCADKLKARGNEARIVTRRQALVKSLREKHGLSHKQSFLKARDLPEVLAKSHKSTNASIDLSTPNWILHDGAAVLSPEVTEGPYYVEGEFIRSNVTENEPGIPLTVDLQVIDINTCKPATNVALEWWSCNSTGVYGGVEIEGDESNISKKALRGIQITDNDGSVRFDAVVPGHYYGRTPHVHIMTHLNSKINANNTISSGQVAHVGQIYFDQDLLDTIEAIEPYTQNTQPLTTNAQDTFMAMGSLNGSDPVIEYVLLGDTVEEGVFGWINFGIDTSINRTVMVAASCAEDGCKTNPNGFTPPADGFPPGLGPPPGMSGLPPMGFPIGSMSVMSGMSTTTTAAPSAVDRATEDDGSGNS